MAPGAFGTLAATDALTLVQLGEAILRVRMCPASAVARPASATWSTSWQRAVTPGLKPYGHHHADGLLHNGGVGQRRAQIDLSGGPRTVGRCSR